MRIVAALGGKLNHMKARDGLRGTFRLAIHRPVTMFMLSGVIILIGFYGVSAAVIGNVLEWYDFAVFGFVASAINAS